MITQNETDMWMVTAIIQDFKLDAVMLSLEALPHFGGMTVSECRGFGHGKLAEEDEGEPERAEAPSVRRRAGLVDFTPKMKLEVAVAGRERADAVVETIGHAAHTGRRGDGKIFVWPIAHAVRVRTMDVGAQAL